MANNEAYKKIAIFNQNDEILLSAVNINTLDNRITLLGEKFNLIPHQTMVNAIGYLDDGIVAIQGKVTLSTESQVNLDIMNFDEKQERRNYLKVRTNLKTNLIRAYALGKSNKSLRVNEAIELRDICVGGLCFYSNKRFFKNQRLSIDFNQIKENFIVEAVVLRREKEDHKIGYQYRYGCEFPVLDNEQQRALCEYVFKKEIENHKKSREIDMNL